MENKNPQPAVAEPGASFAIVVESDDASSGNDAVSASLSLSPFEEAEHAYHAAIKRFVSLPDDLETEDFGRFKYEEILFKNAFRAVDLAPCQSLVEFARAFLIAADNGASIPPEKLFMKLVADAKRLVVQS